MDCHEVRARLPELLTGEGELAAGVAEHVARCEPCRREVADVHRVLELIGRATKVADSEAPPPFEELLARVRSRRRALPRILARVAALLLASLAGAAFDRLLFRDTETAGRDPSARASAARAEARRALAERPGGLGSSLAVLKVLTLEPKRR